MNITAEQREQIYHEEKAKREGGGDSSPLLLLLTVGAVIGLAALLTLTQKHENRVSLEDLRKAYAGLSPEEE